MAQALAAAGRFDEAETVTRELIEHHKDLGSAYDFLVSLYARRNRLAEVEAPLTTRVANNPAEPAYPAQLAAYYHGLRRQPEAAKCVGTLIGNRKRWQDARLPVARRAG